MVGNERCSSRVLKYPRPTNAVLRHLGLLVLFLGLVLLPVMDRLQAQEKGVPPPPQPSLRFQFKIAPNTPLKDLLPVPPSTKKPAGLVADNDLTQVPEVEFQAPLATNLSNEEAMKRTAHMIAKINHLNGKKADHFMEALRKERLDLHGLPMAMGDACRTKGERSRQFALAVATARGALQREVGVFVIRNVPNVVAAPPSAAAPALDPTSPPPAPPAPPWPTTASSRSMMTRAPT